MNTFVRTIPFSQNFLFSGKYVSLVLKWNLFDRIIDSLEFKVSLLSSRVYSVKKSKRSINKNRYNWIDTNKRIVTLYQPLILEVGVFYFTIRGVNDRKLRSNIISKKSITSVTDQIVWLSNLNA